MPTVPTATTTPRSRATSPRKIDRIAAGSFRSDQNRVRAMSAGLLHAQFTELRQKRWHRSAPIRRREFRAFLHQIKSHYSASSRFQQLHGELSEQAESDDSDYVSKFRLGGANPVKGHRTDRSKCRFVE